LFFARQFVNEAVYALRQHVLSECSALVRRKHNAFWRQNHIRVRALHAELDILPLNDVLQGLVERKNFLYRLLPCDAGHVEVYNNDCYNLLFHLYVLFGCLNKIVDRLLTIVEHPNKI
jgi:hypothetical protein